MFKLLSRVFSILLLACAVFFMSSEVSAKSLYSPISDLTDQSPGSDAQVGLKSARDIIFGKFTAELREFIQAVATGDANTITGIFAYNVFAMDVTQQPASNPGYISPSEDTITEFGLARKYGTIGMLAHNYLAGNTFFQLQAGQDVYLVFGDGSLQKYTIVDILSYQALQPNSPYSNFLNMKDAGDFLSAEELFYKVYAQEDALVLQTCIENQGIETWGRLFIIAVPGDISGDLGAL